jgi:nucleoside 2-deoxyribosyltransferase
MKLYFAGPLFTDAERAWNSALAERLRRELPGVEIMLPQDFCAALTHADGRPDHGAIFAACVAHLERATAVFAILDGADPDSGTCWEVGYAYAKGLPIVGLRTDWRPGEDGGANCMLTRACRTFCRSVEAAPAALAGVLERR